MIAQSIRKYQHHQDQDLLWEEVEDYFGVEVHTSAKAYLTKDDLFEGFLYVNHAVEIKDTYYSYHQLLNDEFVEEDGLCPIVCIGGEVYGTYFWLVLTTGDVLSVHYSSFGKMLYDAQASMKSSTKEGFLQAVIKLGSLMKIEQLLALQEASKEIIDLEREDEDAFQVALFRLVAKILGLTEEGLDEIIEQLPLEFIHSRCMDYIEEERS